jgi:hypothetical protein
MPKLQSVPMPLLCAIVPSYSGLAERLPMSDGVTICSGPGYYELRGNYGPQVCFVEPAPQCRQVGSREWFKVSATAEDQAKEGTMLASAGALAGLLIRKVEGEP